MLPRYIERSYQLKNQEIQEQENKLEQPKTMATKQHVKSISLPARSHPSTARVEEQLNKLKSMEANYSSASFSSHSLCLCLSGLGALYECADDLLNMGSTKQVLSQKRHEKCMDELVEGPVRLLDVCGTTRDVLMQINEHVQALQSALRRRKGDFSTLENSITIYTCFRKKMNKDVKKLANKFGPSLFSISLPQDDHNNDHFYAVIRVLRQVWAVNISIFRSLLGFLTFSSGSKSKSKSNIRKWSLAAKLIMYKGVVACEEGLVCVNELESVDGALICSTATKLGDGEKIQTAQKRLEALENSIQGLESGLENVFRRLIKTRASLLNIISQ